MNPRIPILVSACLLGVACRYDGASKPNPILLELAGKYTLIPICPEVSGGLLTPREPSEICGDRVINRAGADVTAAYSAGAEAAVELAKRYGCRLAILKEKSPSCGLGQIYDGSFSRRLVDGSGITARALLAAGVTVIGDGDSARLRRLLEDI